MMLIANAEPKSLLLVAVLSTTLVLEACPNKGGGSGGNKELHPGYNEIAKSLRNPGRDAKGTGFNPNE